MKKITALLLAGLLLLSLSACGLPLLPGRAPAAEPSAAPESADPEPEEAAPAVTLYLGAAPADEAESERLDAALTRLREALPDIAVERVPLPGAGGALPDLLMPASGERLEELAAAGLLADLAEEPAAAALLKKLIPAERERLPAEGPVYALPQRGAEFYGLFADGAVFEANGIAAPRTLDELGPAAAALADRGVTALPLCLEDDAAALAFFEIFLSGFDERGLNALFRGELSPYDRAVWQAADAICRLRRADAATLLSREAAEALRDEGGAALRFAAEREAAGLSPLPCRAVLAGGEGWLAVSAASEHRDLAVDAACLLCGFLAEYDLNRGGACLALSGEGAEPGTLGAYRQTLESFTVLEPGISPELAAAAAEGVRELLRGTMTPDEFAEYTAMTLDARP